VSKNSARSGIGLFSADPVSLTETLGFVVGLVQTRSCGGFCKVEKRRDTATLSKRYCASTVLLRLFSTKLQHSSRPAALLGSVGKREAGIHIGWASCGVRRIDETTVIVSS
jgi:hypothetical protein